MIHDLIARSSATPEFRAALEEFLASGRPNEKIAFDARRSPNVKVERTLTRLLEAHPELALESVSIDGNSGCEYYRGTLTAVTADAEHRIEFYWDCKWRAEQQGWRDAFGFADQIRAAREFGYDCFREWAPEISVDAAE